MPTPSSQTAGTAPGEAKTTRVEARHGVSLEATSRLGITSSLAAEAHVVSPPARLPRRRTKIGRALFANRAPIILNVEALLLLLDEKIAHSTARTLRRRALNLSSIKASNGDWKKSARPRDPLQPARSRRRLQLRPLNPLRKASAHGGISATSRFAIRHSTRPYSCHVREFANCMVPRPTSLWSCQA